MTGVVADKIAALAAAGAFGLAYHLRRAAGSVFPGVEFPFTPLSSGSRR